MSVIDPISQELLREQRREETGLYLDVKVMHSRENDEP